MTLTPCNVHVEIQEEDLPNQIACSPRMPPGNEHGETPRAARKLTDGSGPKGHLGGVITILARPKLARLIAGTTVRLGHPPSRKGVVTHASDGGQKSKYPADVPAHPRIRITPGLGTEVDGGVYETDVKQEPEGKPKFLQDHLADVEGIDELP